MMFLKKLKASSWKLGNSKILWIPSAQMISIVMYAGKFKPRLTIFIEYLEKNKVHWNLCFIIPDVIDAFQSKLKLLITFIDEWIHDFYFSSPVVFIYIILVGDYELAIRKIGSSLAWVFRISMMGFINSFTHASILVISHSAIPNLQSCSMIKMFNASFLLTTL